MAHQICKQCIIDAEGLTKYKCHGWHSQEFDIAPQICEQSTMDTTDLTEKASETSELHTVRTKHVVPIPKPVEASKATNIGILLTDK